MSMRFELRPIHIKEKRWAAPPTANHRFRHWSQERKVKAAWREYAWAKCREAGALRCEKARITITRYAVRDVDQDNLTACVKPILDGIVDAKVVPDDKRAHVELHVLLERVAHFADERITVEIVVVESSAEAASSGRLLP
jgi:hypothetical protein